MFGQNINWRKKEKLSTTVIIKKLDQNTTPHNYKLPTIGIIILSNSHINQRKKKKFTDHCHYEKTRLKYPST
jgi:hypothetical protein